MLYQLSYAPGVLSEGIEPSLTPWKGAVLPLDEESRLFKDTNVNFFIQRFR